MPEKRSTRLFGLDSYLSYKGNRKPIIDLSRYVFTSRRSFRDLVHKYDAVFFDDLEQFLCPTFGNYYVSRNSPKHRNSDTGSQYSMVLESLFADQFNAAVPGPTEFTGIIRHRFCFTESNCFQTVFRNTTRYQIRFDGFSPLHR